MPIEKSQGKPRPANYRVDELPTRPESAIAAPDRDATTGRFVKGNRASRRRKVKALAGKLVGLDPTKVAPWLRPHVAQGNEQAARLLEQLPARNEAIDSLVVALANATTMHWALIGLGAAGDAKAREEAMRWLREMRQLTITIEGLSRDLAASQPKITTGKAWIEAEAARLTAASKDTE
jgi:hypothetical protein